MSAGGQIRSGAGGRAVQGVSLSFVVAIVKIGVNVNNVEPWSR